MAAAQNINPETSGLRERFAALTGAKDLAHPLDPELLEVARIRLPYDEIAENVRALHPLPYNISTREVMLLCERFQQLFGAHLEIISARASTLQNLSAFTDHIVDLPEVDFDDAGNPVRAVVGAYEGHYRWTLDYEKLVVAYLTALDLKNAASTSANKLALRPEILAEIVEGKMDETYVMRWFPSTAIALAEFEQKSIYRLGSSKEIEIARSLMPEFEQGADPLSDAEVHTQIQAEKIESAAARLAELRTEAFSHTPLVEVWNSETPDQSYAAAKQAGTLEQDGTKRTIALRQVRKMLAEWGVEHTVKDPHDILGELEAMLAGAIDRQQSRVQQMQESESPEQVLTPQREVLAQRQYIIEAIRSNRDWLIRLSF